MIWDNFRIALAAIRANKMRSLLTTLGIIIGVAAVIAVVSIVQGLNYVIATQLEGVGAAYIRVQWREDPTNPDLAGREVVLTYEDGLAIFERATALEYFNPIFFRGEQLRLQRPAPCDHHARGRRLPPGGQQPLGRARPLLLPARPRPPGPGLHHRPRHHRRARARRRPLGKEIIVGQSTFTVVGVMQEMGEIFGQSRDDLLLIPITTARDLYGQESFKRLILDFQATSAETVALAKDQITEVLRDRHHIPEGTEDDFRWCSRRRS